MRILLLILAYNLFFINTAIAEDSTPSTCFEFSESATRYTDSKKGEVVFHTPLKGHIPNVTDLACVVVVEFLNKVNDVPNKSVIGIVTKDYRYFYAMQWNLADDYLLIIEARIPKATRPTAYSEWSGIFTKYPNPLLRLKEIITKKGLPSPKNMTPTERARFSINKVTFSIPMIKTLVNPTFKGE